MIKSSCYIIVWISLCGCLCAQSNRFSNAWQLGLDPTRLYHNLYGARMLGADVIVQRQMPNDVSIQLGVGFASYSWEPAQTGNRMTSSGFAVKPTVLYRVYESLSLGGTLWASIFKETLRYEVPSDIYPSLKRELGPYNQMIWGFEMQLLYTHYWGRWGVGVMPRVAFAVGGRQRDELTPQGAQKLDQDQTTAPLLYLPGIGKENVTGTLYPALQVFFMVRPLRR